MTRDGRGALIRAGVKWLVFCSCFVIPTVTPQSQMTIADPWNRVIENWRRSKLAIRAGVSNSAIAVFQAKYDVVLPVDVRDYFLAADGTGDEMDDGLYRFWPLAEVKPVHEALADTEHFSWSDRFSYPDCFVFADHSINCWDYSLKLTDDPTQSAPVFRVTFDDPPGEPMASSFLEFMERYADNPSSIL